MLTPGATYNIGSQLPPVNSAIKRKDDSAREAEIPKVDDKQNTFDSSQKGPYTHPDRARLIKQGHEPIDQDRNTHFTHETREPSRNTSGGETPQQDPEEAESDDNGPNHPGETSMPTSSSGAPGGDPPDDEDDEDGGGRCKPHFGHGKGLRPSSSTSNEQGDDDGKWKE